MSNTYEINLARLRKTAQENGLILNPDQDRVKKVVGLMSENYDLTQEWICPCKQTVHPPEKGRDKTCPCDEWLDEASELGHCFCRLFYTEEKAKEVQS